MAKYLEDKRRRLQGQTQAAPVQKQPVQYTPKTAPAVQTQEAAPAPAEKQTYTAPKTPAQKQTATPTQTTTAPAQIPGSDVVAQAQQYLNQQLGGYNSRYGSQINDLVAQIQNRPKFEYDVNTDPLYLQLRDIWKQDGLMAMEDTMGQAAQLTGGYGNSHAQMAGQQVYNGYLRQVNEMVPELKEAARADYDADTDVLLRNLGLLMDQDSTDYARWMDELERQRYAEQQEYDRGRDALSDERYDREWEYQTGRDALSDERYDREWEYQTGRDQLADQRYQDELAYGREQDQYQRQQQSYDRLLELIIATGYKPTAEELAAAGMTEAEAKAWLGYYTANQAVGGSGGSSGGGSRGSGGSGGGGGSGSGSNSGSGGGSGGPTGSLEEQLKVLAGNGVNVGVLTEYINEAYKDGEIDKQRRDELVAWAKSLFQPGAGSQTGGRGNSNDFRVTHHG